mmetsp:Transcript_57177/g.113547  ORF Transcript_57177/g.113547 Transcript_57177/m.113547 type:complete len:207 (-) Transcript_57177:86-706(-)
MISVGGPRATEIQWPSDISCMKKRHCGKGLPSTLTVASCTGWPLLPVTISPKAKSQRENSKPKPSPRAFVKASLRLQKRRKRSSMRCSSGRALWIVNISEFVSWPFIMLRFSSMPRFLPPRCASGAATSTPHTIAGSVAMQTYLPSCDTLKFQLAPPERAPAAYLGLLAMNGLLPLVRSIATCEKATLVASKHARRCSNRLMSARF